MPISEQEMERLKEIFITREECHSSREEVSKKFGRDDVRLSVIENQLKLILWLLSAIGTAIIAVLVKLFFGG